LDNVVLKETYVLKKFSITNLLEIPLRIQIKTDLPQVKFQTENENFADLQWAEEDEDLEPIQADHFNQFFNDINLVDEVHLGPRRTQSIFLSFRPMYDVEKEDSSESDEEDVLLSHGLSDYLNNYTDVQGHVTLTASADEDSELSGSERELNIKLMARICRSLLKVDRSEITFDDCVRGGTYVKDFTLWNCSEMPLSFLLTYTSASNANHVLEFYDNETGLPVANPNHVIPGYYHIPIRISFKPLEVGEFDFHVKIENKNDSNNVENIHIHAVVFSKPQHFTESIVLQKKYTLTIATLEFRHFEFLRFET